MLGISAGPLAERNDGLHVVGAQSFAQPAGIKSLIADQGQAMDTGHESVKAAGYSRAIAQSSEFFSTVSAAKKAGDRALAELFENQLIS